MTRKTSKTIVLGVLALFGTVLFSCAVHQSIARTHPVDVKNMSQCSDCHADWRASLDHRSDFIKKHKFAASQRKQACDVCHAESFCSDCHANKEEINPGDKFKDAPERNLPHRGDYLNQHRIDGRLNPASCVTCHGRQNNERCRVCHR